MTKKKPVVARYDNNRTRLKTSESQRPNGTYVYRWTTQDGKRNAVYAPTLETLREQEEQIIEDIIKNRTLFRNGRAEIFL